MIPGKCWIAYGGKIVSPVSLYVTLALRIVGSAPARLASGACAVIAMELPGSSWRRRVVSELSAERQRLVI